MVKENGTAKILLEGKGWLEITYQRLDEATETQAPEAGAA
jgi:hypothetical protein